MRVSTLMVLLVVLALGISYSGTGLETSKVDENGYATIPGNHYLIQPGKPMLPYKVTNYILPTNSRIKSIDVKVVSSTKVILHKKIMPSPAITAPSYNNYEITGSLSQYKKDEFYPGKLYDYRIGRGIYNGNESVFVSVYTYPYQYNPVRNELIYNKIEVNIDYDTNGSENGVRSVDNYNLLIIAPDKWLGSLQPLVEHKNSHGVKTKLVGLSEALKENGRDDAEKVKYFIKDEIEKDGIKYVMLVGDKNNFPVRYSYAYDGEEEKFVSDLYYADIYDSHGSFSSWDSNGNGIYGEYNHNGNKDDVDLYPDVYIGRLACSNEAELNTVINKIIEYEDNSFNQPWTNRIAGFGGDSHDDNGGVYEGEKIKDDAFRSFNGYDIVKYYASQNTLSKSSIINEFKNGGILYNFAGHGNRVSWATHPPKQFNTWIGFDITDIYKFSNGDKLPFIILNACETGQFDQGICLAWKLVGVSGRGGIASMAATALSWEYTGNYCTAGLSGYLDVKFCRYFDKGVNAGDILGKSLTDYIRYQPMDSATHYKVVEEWTLFGDPTLVIGGYGEGGKASVKIVSPEEGYIYISGNKIMPSFSGKTVIIGNIEINVSAYNCNKVEFYLDNSLKYTDENAPYSWEFNERAFFSHQIKVIGYGNESTDEDSINAIIFHL